MQAVEALQRLIGMADELMGLHPSQRPANEDNSEDKIAVAVIQAMLNTALPVARFRCFVRIESGREKGREYTICGVHIEDIVTALYPLSRNNREVYILLFEQRSTGADALDGYQGNTTKGFKADASFVAYLEGLRKYSVSALAN